MANSTYIGQLNERITIQSKVAQKSPISGATSNDWAVLKNCWAKATDVSGSEEIEGRSRYVNIKTFTIRYDRAMVNATDRRIEYLGDYYNIIAVLAEGKKRYQLLKAELDRE